MTPKRREKLFRRPQKCGFSYGNTPNGECRECGEPAEPGIKQLCIDCSIEQGNAPVAPPADKNKESNGK